MQEEKPNNALSASDRDKAIDRAAYKWNTAAGILNAFQSVAILVVLTRVCDAATAGVFTLAYANGNLFLHLGKYGMRSFQASDRQLQFSFPEYRTSRLFTTLAMLVAGGAYLAYSSVTLSYGFEKTAVIAVMCLYEAVAAIEDVYHGNFQQHGRLDVAARLLAVRIATTIIVLCSVVVMSRSLFLGISIGTIYTMLFLVGEIAFSKRNYGLPVMDGGLTRQKVTRLLRTCFPLFAASFLLFYIGNAPRYAIDAQMSDISQAYYGYIAMPVFVVSLLAGFIYNPMIASLADQWRNGQVNVFVKRFVKIMVAIVCLTLACDAAALFAGVPVLNLLYNADTAPFLFDLVVLVTGGGFLALVSLAVLGITIIRFQRVLVPAYMFAAIAAWAVAGWSVSVWGIDGASWTYFSIMAFLAILLSCLFVVGIRIQSKA